jgi:hypothetical protein
LDSTFHSPKPFHSIANLLVIEECQQSQPVNGAPALYTKESLD